MPIVAPLLLAAACNVQNDAANNQTTITIDREAVGNVTDDLGKAARDTGAELERAGDAIGNEARRIDVDVRRDGDGNANRQ
jgi:hypothetical protein